MGSMTPEPDASTRMFPVSPDWPAMISALRTTKNMSASAKLLSGPAADVQKFALFFSRHASGLTGTGFAHPKRGIPVNELTSGNRTVPIGSMCTIGFSEMRPSERPRSSPNLSETYAWADSCTESEKRNTMNQSRMSSGLMPFTFGNPFSKPQKWAR